MDKQYLEDAEKQEIYLYGASATDWLERWDRGDGCWSIEMGGLGPGFDQCIHITMAEILRRLLARQYSIEAWHANNEAWKRDRDEIESIMKSNATIKGLGGISGAQWGAALNLATNFYRQGPVGVMKDKRVKDRHIQVQKHFPKAA